MGYFIFPEALKPTIRKEGRPKPGILISVTGERLAPYAFIVWLNESNNSIWMLKGDTFIGFSVQCSATPLAFEAASLIEKETATLRSLKQEYRMSNIEGRNSIEFYGFKRQSAAIPPFVILRFAVWPLGVSYEGRKRAKTCQPELENLILPKMRHEPKRSWLTNFFSWTLKPEHCQISKIFG